MKDARKDLCREIAQIMNIRREHPNYDNFSKSELKQIREWAKTNVKALKHAYSTHGVAPPTSQPTTLDTATLELLEWLREHKVTLEHIVAQSEATAALGRSKQHGPE